MKPGTRRRAQGARGIFLGLLLAACFAGPAAAEKWSGVDEAVVEKIAREHGREAKPPLVDTGQGDLLLFAFLLAGAAGGFAAGYWWRMLTEKKPDAAAAKHEQDSSARNMLQ